MAVTLVLYNFFANLGDGWVNGATVVSAIFGILFSIFAFFFSIWFSGKLSASTDKLLVEANQVSTAIKNHTEAIQAQTAAIHKHTKILRLDNLRYLYEISRGNQYHEYWHYRWRFETYDCLNVTVYDQNNDKYLGGCDLMIQGFSNEADHLGFEHRTPEFYVAKIKDAQAGVGHNFPFKDGDLVAVFCVNSSHLVISKGTDPYTMEQMFKLTIAGLGHTQFQSDIPKADTAQIFQRIKDS